MMRPHQRTKEGLLIEFTGAVQVIAQLRDQLAQAQKRAEHMENAAIKQDYEIQQTLGKALGYAYYKDDQINFPGTTEADGVCVGLEVAETLATAAAEKITQLTTMLSDEPKTKTGLPDRNRHLLPAVQATYRKHVQGREDIGWNELGDLLMTALCESMGDAEFQAWLHEDQGDASTTR